MFRLMKTLAALAAMTAAPLAFAAHTVGAPLAGTVTATTYSTSGAYHGAVDIRGGACGQTPVYTGVVGSLSWTVTIKSSATGCGSSLSAQNEASHTFGTGWTFRLRGFVNSAGSISRTCDRCNIGTAFNFSGDAIVEPLHLQHDKLGTRDSQWYVGTVKGEALSLGEVVGYLD